METLGKRLLRALAPPLGYAYIRLARATMRVEYRNRDELQRARERSGPYVLAFWHSRFLLMPYCYPGDKLVVLQSRHRDSQILAEVTRRFGLEAAFGSSSTGGAQAMRQVLRRMKNGYDLGIAPDGPRGPRRIAQPGVVAISRLSGKPIIPVAFSARRAKRLGSWDRTLLPLPFGRGLFIYGEALIVPRNADEEGQELFRAKLEAELNRLTDLADREVGTPLEDPREPDDAS
jgi:lysophospholipid acyltransferase (LPLAT)-like uncharacterized protein